MVRSRYRFKKGLLANKRYRIVLGGIAVIAVIAIVSGVFTLFPKKVTDAGKTDIILQTGDRPIQKENAIYINADGGLSLRADRSTTSDRIALIPNGTKLVATEELEGWYKVVYEDKSGWVSKQYTTADAPAEDPTKGWATYSSGLGYKIKYQTGWKSQNYGANDVLKATELVAFSNQELPSTIPAGSEFIAPVTVAVSTKNIADAENSYATIAGVQTESTAVAGIAAKKYTYTSSGSNTQMTAVVFGAGGKVFVFSEGGGYADDLLKMAATFTIG